MRKPSKFIVVAGALAALAVPSAAMADAPNGDYAGSYKANRSYEQSSFVGQASSRSIQNGQFISGTVESFDQTTTPGSRADLVQGYHLEDGIGSLAK